MSEQEKIENTKMTKKKKILIITLIVLLPFIIYAGNIGVRLYNIYSTMHQPIEEEQFEFDPNDLIDQEDDEEHKDQEDTPTDQVEEQKFIDDKYYDAQRSPKDPNKLNILLIGVDARTMGGGGRADSIMIVQYNKETQKSAILSIPRDTYVKIPGRGYDKINHSYAFGRTALLKSTIEGYLDIHIDHYAQVDMQSFKKIIDQLGGITVTVPEDMIHTNGNVLFEKGTFLMDGDQVLRYTGARKLQSGGGSDFGRIKRQQQVITIILDTIKQDFSMMKTIDLMEEISPYVRTDITPAVIMKNWSAFNNLNINQITLSTLTGTGFMHNRTYYLRTPITQARQTTKDLTN